MTNEQEELAPGAAIGIDIGATRVKSALVDSSGAILSQHAEPAPESAAQLERMLRETAAIHPGAPMGIGCKGIIDHRSSRIVSLPGTLRFLEGLRLDDLAGRPVRADNDARVAMVGEAVWGAARGRRNAILLTLGTGVGGAVIAEGRLLRGHGGAGGHLGHITVRQGGAYCICGNRGCLETVFSSKAIEADAFRAVHAGVATTLRDRFHAAPEKLTCAAVFQAAAEGDTVALSIRDEAITELGAAIAGLAHVFDPEVVIVGGQISEAGDVLFNSLRKEIHWRTRVLLRRDVPVAPPGVADRSGVVGAAALWLCGEGLLD